MLLVVVRGLPYFSYGLMLQATSSRRVQKTWYRRGGFDIRHPKNLDGEDGKCFWPRYRDPEGVHGKDA